MEGVRQILPNTCVKHDDLIIKASKFLFAIKTLSELHAGLSFSALHKYPITYSYLKEFMGFVKAALMV